MTAQPEKSDTLVTDEMVERAMEAIADCPASPLDWRTRVRAGIEAVQGDIIEAFGASGRPG